MAQDTVITLKLDDVVASPEVNIRINDLNHDKVKEYAENFHRLPFPKVFLVKETGISKLNEDRRHNETTEITNYVLVDGAHRMAAARQLQLTELSFQVVGQGSFDDAKDYADRANLEHGLNLTYSQKQSIAKRVQQRHSDWSERQIAEFLGVSASTVHYWLTEQQNRAALNQSKMPKAGRAMLLFQKIGSDFKRCWSKLDVKALEDERLLSLHEFLKPQVDAYYDLENELEERKKAVGQT